jgi:hypothetical protein
MTETEFEPPRVFCLTSARHEWRQDSRPGPPRHVKTWHGIATPLGPADYGKPADAELVEPGALFTGSELQVCIGPLPRPMVFGTIEPGCAQPVQPGAFERIGDAKQPLFG